MLSAVKFPTKDMLSAVKIGLILINNMLSTVESGESHQVAHFGKDNHYGKRFFP